MRELLEAQAGEAVAGRLEVADVDLWLLCGAVAVEGVRFFADGAPSPAAPMLELRRLYLNLGWGSLLRRTLRLEALEIAGPVLRVDRMPDGAPFLPALRVAEAAPASEAAGEPWDVVVDDAVLTDGRLQLVDHVVDPPEAVDLSLDGLRVSSFRLRDGGDAAPGQATIEARFRDGGVRLTTSLASRADGFALHAGLTAQSLPLDELQVHVPQLGWSGLQGRLDGTLQLTAEPGRQPSFGGELAVRDLAVRVGGEESPVLGWRELAVSIERIDLERREAVLGRVALGGGRVVVAPGAPAPLPVLGFLAAAGASDGAAPAPATPAATGTAAAPAAQPSPDGAPPGWTWSVGTIELAEVAVDVRLPAGPLAVDLVSVELRGLASAAGKPVEVAARARVADGTIAVSGAVQPDPIAGKLRVEMDGLGLAPLAAAGGAALRPASGTLGCDLRLELAPPEAGGAARLAGRIAVRDLAVGGRASEDPFFAGWKRLEVAIGELSAPAAVARRGAAPPATGAASPAGPIRVRLASVELEEPAARLTRDASGIVLPGARAADAGAGGGPAPPLPSPSSAAPPATADTPPATAATPPATAAAPHAPAASESSPAAAASPAPPAIDVRADRVRIAAGKVSVLDRTVQPFFRGEVDAMALDARGLEWPAGTFARLSFSARLPGDAKLEVAAKRTGDAVDVDASAERIGLAAFNPYLTQARTYTVAGGTASLHTRLRWQRDAYESANDVALDDLELAGAEGDTIFADRFGVPLSLALSLLRDLNGRIALSVPVSGERSAAARIDLGTVVAQALSKAILGAITSPLKLLGAVTTSGGKVTGFAPAPIPFVAGRAEPADDAWWRIEQLAGGLASMPALRVSLRGSAGGDDARALQEAALLADLQADKGIVETLRGLPSRRQDNAIRDFLAARARGEAAELDADDAAALEQRLAAKPVSDAELAALAAARADRLRGLLARDYGVPGDRIAIAAPEEGAQGTPAVVPALGAR